jgi:putative Ca2+/H+ antiporter (TMEM165/GDT1 family)
VSAFLLIFFSELGDKTFFIALLLALRQPRGAVFSGTFGALAAMTVISVALGQALHQLDGLLPASSLPWDDLLAVALLVYFGINTLRVRLMVPPRVCKDQPKFKLCHPGCRGSWRKRC